MTPSNAIAAPLCASVFAVPPRIETGRSYWVQMKDSSTIIKGRLVSISENGSFYDFKIKTHQGQELLTLDRSQIAHTKKVPSPRDLLSWNTNPRTTWEDAVKFLREFLQGMASMPFNLHDMFDVYMPKFSKAQGSHGVTVKALRPWGLRETAQKIADSIDFHDQKMTDIGFSLPEFTIVSIHENRFRPSSGPAFSPHPMISRGSKHFIRMVPFFGDKQYVHEPFVAMHERTHSILFATYAPHSRVNAELTYNEALADFFAAHSLGESGSPWIKRNLRDLENLRNNNRDMPSILELTGEAHNDGVFLSHLLWKTRDRIGIKAMSEILKPFVDGLNRFDPPASEGQSSDVKIVALQKLNFAIAVLERVSAGTPHQDQVRQTIDDYARNLSLDREGIRQLSDNLVDSGSSMPLVGRRTGDMIIGAQLAAVGAVSDFFFFSVVFESVKNFVQ